ncbi:MAG TPA: carboxypeptidase-like regulatory domain-containing protein [Crinalium sp.]|jgi:uncharacterized membrane protein
MNSIYGRVTDPQGNPIPQATVLFTGSSPTHTDIAARTNATGEYRYTNLTPGLYTLMVNAEGFPTQTQQIQVNSGEDAQLDFHLDSQIK